MGCKFYRQHPLFFDILGKETFFIADFYCHEARLVVEIDGGVHELQEEYDALRTEVINTLGIGVLRFPNELVDSDLPAGLETLKKHLTSEGIGRSDLASIGTHPKSLS